MEQRKCENCGCEIGLLADERGVCPHCGYLLPHRDLEGLPEALSLVYQRLWLDAPGLTNSASEIENILSRKG